MEPVHTIKKPQWLVIVSNMCYWNAAKCVVAKLQTSQWKSYPGSDFGHEMPTCWKILS